MLFSTINNHKDKRAFLKWNIEISSRERWLSPVFLTLCLMLISLTSLAQTGLDTDGDGIVDEIDLDDDNDGILDTEECEDLITYFDWTGLSLAEGDIFSSTSITLVNGSILNATVEYVSGTAQKIIAEDITDRPGSAFYNGPGLEGIVGGENTQDTNFKLRFTTNIPIDVLFTDGETLHSLEPAMITTSNGQGWEVVAVDSPSLVNISGLGTQTLTYSSNADILTSPTEYGAVLCMSKQSTELITEISQWTTGISGTMMGIMECYLDTDNDGIPDQLDPDSDNDGCLDVIEAGHIDDDNDGFVDGTGYDSNGQVTGATSAYTGNNAAVVNIGPDSDGDGISDACDLTVVNSDTICLGDCITLEVSTLFGTPPYTYQWDNGVNSNTESIEVCPTTTTTYTVIITDSSGDIDSSIGTITVIPAIAIDLGEDQLSCSSANLILDPGDPTYSYNWSDNSTNATFSVLASGEYWVEASNGYCIDSDTVNITFIDDYNFENDTLLCVGATLNVGATIFDSYLWSTGETTSSIEITESGSYWVEATSGSCSITDTFDVIFQEPKALFIADPIAGCSPHTVDFSDESTGNIEAWYWDFGNGESSNTQNPNTITYPEPGSFTVSLKVTDSDGCSNVNIETNYIEVYSLPQASFSFSPHETTMLNPEIQFTNETIDLASSFWLFGDGSSSDMESPIHEYDEEGEYMVTLEVTNENGCTDETNWSLIIHEPFLIYVPNSFTPDGDGINDLFKPIVSGIDINDYLFSIYDRWGHLVFETNDYKESWNGSYLKRSSQSDYYAPDGTYNWMINVKNINTSETEMVKGNVTIIR